MSKLAKSVKYAYNFSYLLEVLDANPLAVQHFYSRYPDFASDWPDLSEYSQDDLDEMDALLKQLCLHPIVNNHIKAVPEDDAA